MFVAYMRYVMHVWYVVCGMCMCACASLVGSVSQSACVWHVYCMWCVHVCKECVVCVYVCAYYYVCGMYGVCMRVRV